MHFHTAYVVKEMSQKDFSELYSFVDDVKFLFEEGKAQMPFPDIIGDVMWGIAGFSPDQDLLVLAGSNAACVAAFATLLIRFGRVNVATYLNGRYEVHEVRMTHYSGSEKNQMYTRQLSESRDV